MPAGLIDVERGGNQGSLKTLMNKLKVIAAIVALWSLGLHCDLTAQAQDASGDRMKGTQTTHHSTKGDSMNPQVKFEFRPLPYSYDALEPFIDKRTVEIHYSKHHRT